MFSVVISATHHAHLIYKYTSTSPRYLHGRCIHGVTELQCHRSPPNPLPASPYQASHIPLSPDVPSRSASFAPNANDLSRSETQHFLATPQAHGQNRDISPAVLYASSDWLKACRQQACRPVIAHHSFPQWSRVRTPSPDVPSCAWWACSRTECRATVDRNGPCLGIASLLLRPVGLSCSPRFGRLACFTVHVLW